MPKRSTEELIAAHEQKIAELKANVGQTKLTRIERINAEITKLDERIGKLEATKQAKVDERDQLQSDINEAEQSKAALHVSAGA